MCKVFQRLFSSKQPQPSRFETWSRAVRAATSLEEVVHTVYLRESHSVRVKFNGETEWRTVSWSHMGPYHEHNEWDEQTRGNFRAFVGLVENGELVRQISDLIRTVAMQYTPREVQASVPTSSCSCPIHDVPEIPRGKFDDFEADLRDRFQTIGLLVFPRVGRS